MAQQDHRPHVVVRRADRPGDLGRVVMAHGEVDDRQHGWTTDFEALVAGIVADYAMRHGPDTEAAWIAEADGRRAGCVLLTAGDEPGVAELRMHAAPPAARHAGPAGRDSPRHGRPPVPRTAPDASRLRCSRVRRSGRLPYGAGGPQPLTASAIC